MVSVKDIARECGVSVATVSKALNDYSDVGKETRDRVKATAARLGYFPNSSARALKTKRTYNLGVLFEDEARSGLTHDFFGHVLESFKVTAEKKGYDITFTCRSISTRVTSYLEHCRYRGVDGVVIACIDFSKPSVQELVNSTLPVVTIDHEFDNRISVISDNMTGMKELTEYAAGRGHRKIAYIHGGDSSVTRIRLNSFQSVMREHGITVPEEYVTESPYLDVNGAMKRTSELLALADPPTCIFYPDDVSCIGGINWLRSKGLMPGKDISVAGYDGAVISEIFEPKLTTVCQDTKKIGEYAAEKLISLIESPKMTGVDRIIVPSKLREGRTVADLRNNS